MNRVFILRSSARRYSTGMKLPWSRNRERPKPDLREEEARDLEHFRRDVGMNYDAGFGSLSDDVAAADVDQTMHEHRVHEE